MSEIQPDVIPLYLAFTLLTVIFIFFVVAVMIRMKSRQMKKDQDMLRLLVAERERTMYTISVELHNNVNQLLSLTKMTINMIEIKKLPEQDKYIDQAKRLLGRLIMDISNISHSLNADFLKSHGLYEFLTKEKEWINLSTELDCSLDIRGTYRSFPEETELIIIRMTQEVIQNALKHAEAGNINIDLHYDDGLFTLGIRDNGKGFNTADIKPEGMGIQSLYNRCKIINCDIDLKSQEGMGTEVIFIISNPKYKEECTKST